eukprot:2020417-Alexandrium_andersonii.AAC.1
MFLPVSLSLSSLSTSPPDYLSVCPPAVSFCIAPAFCLASAPSPLCLQQFINEPMNLRPSAQSLHTRARALASKQGHQCPAR